MSAEAEPLRESDYICEQCPNDSVASASSATEFRFWGESCLRAHLRNDWSRFNPHHFIAINKQQRRTNARRVQFPHVFDRGAIRVHLLAVVADRLSKRLGTPPDRARLVIHNRRALHGPASIAMQDEAIDATTRHAAARKQSHERQLGVHAIIRREHESMRARALLR